MSNVIGIAGSLRTGSYNRALLNAAAELAPEGLTVEVGSIEGIPLYHADHEREQGVPDVVRVLKDRVAAADGLLLVTPEYNSSIPGTFKNAIDWLSRPSKDIPRVFGGKPVGLMGASPGRGATRGAQTAWLPVLRRLGTQHWSGKELFVGGARDVFGADGRLVDEAIRRLLTEYMAGFADFVRRSGPATP